MDDDFEFYHTKVILRDGPQLFYAKSESRDSPRFPIDPSSLELHPFSKLDICPEYSPNYTQALDVTLPHVYVKQPSLIHCGDSKDMTEVRNLVLQEAQIYEMLAQSPHPNVAKYLGCQVENGLITGLCLEKYGISLSQMVDEEQKIDVTICRGSIKKGIEHLHSLGLVHGDLNPNNILSHGEGFVVIDFDSCARRGEKLGLKGGTEQYTQDYDIAEFSNDWYAFDKIVEYLQEHSANVSIPTARM